MGTVNTATRQFMMKNEIAADVFNFLLYDGQQIIQPENLTELDTAAADFPYALQFSDGHDHSSARIEGQPLEKYRDILKQLTLKTDGETVYAILGIENQDSIHYAMPIRNMLYDALSYSRQIKQLKDMHQRNHDWKGHSGDEFLSGLHKEDRLYPVITVVVYFGPEKWDGPTSLHDMLQVSDKRILSMIDNYHIHLITPESLDQNNIDKFHTNLREVLLFIKQTTEKQSMLNLIRTDPGYKNLDPEAVMVMTACTNIDIRYKIKEGKVDMCKAFDDLTAELLTEGKKLGIEQGVHALLKICHQFGLAYEVAKEHIIREFTLTHDVAEKYMQQYWN